MGMFPQGKLLVVATPIGNLDDISVRALASLRSADRILCEDTRVSRKLLDHYGINVRLSSLNEHNERQQITRIVTQLLEGRTFALISDAGTPTISDPGCRLIAALHAADVEVVSLPGASAVVAALAGAGLNAESFVFEGFLPARRNARQSRLRALKDEHRTLVLYEAPHRLDAMLEDMESIFGVGRRICLAKELTKAHERFVYDTVAAVRRWLARDARRSRGEFVVVVAGAPVRDKSQDQTFEVAASDLLALLLDYLPASNAASLAAKLCGGRRNQWYQRALQAAASATPRK